MSISKDPFERLKAIRKGELDAERPAFEEISGWLGRVPLSWLPGLLIRVTQLCVLRKVFLPGGLERTVAKIVAQGGNPVDMRKDEIANGGGR